MHQVPHDSLPAIAMGRNPLPYDCHRDTLQAMNDLRMLLAARRTERRLPPPAERRRLRLAARLTQPELAAFVGVGAPALCRWEGGTRTPHGELAARYAAALATIRVEVDG